MKSLFTLLFSMAFIISFSQTAEEYEKMALKKIELKDYKYAMVLIDKAIALDNKNQWYYLTKAEIQFNLSGPIDAIGIVKSAILLDKKKAEPYSRAGAYYSSRGLTDSSLIMYNYAIQYAENDTALHSYILNRGEAKIGMRDFEGATKDFETVLTYNPKDIAALNNISPCYRELGMPDKSIISLKKIIKLDSTFIGSYINLGFLYLQLDSLDMSLYYFNKAIELDPKEPLSYNNRGNVYYKKGDYSNALKDINLSISMYSTNSYAYRNLALVYLAMNNMNEACTVLGYAVYYGFEKRYGDEVSELIKKYCKK